MLTQDWFRYLHVECRRLIVVFPVEKAQKRTARLYFAGMS
jgi:hypothetical protein